MDCGDPTISIDGGPDLPVPLKDVGRADQVLLFDKGDYWSCGDQILVNISSFVIFVFNIIYSVIYIPMI